MSRSAGRRPAGRRFPRCAIVCSCIGLLAGCGLFSGEPEVLAPCPGVQVLQGAEATSVYAPGRQGEPSGLRYVAGLRDLASACRYGDDGVEVDLAFSLLVERGPAFEGDLARLDYFVATVAPGQEIRSKQLLTSEVSLPAGATTAGFREELTLRLPPMTASEATRLDVYLGFQLDDGERRAGRLPLLMRSGPAQPPPEDRDGAPSPSP